ncbi:MAG: hypothetical protein AAFX57_19055 [Bacteroidota bacterium]
MPLTADCINTKSINGRNATPLGVFPAVRYVLGSINLDPASDHEINAQVVADRIYSLKNDGFVQQWEAKTLWLNPPGTTVTGGTSEERLYWLSEMKKKAEERSPKPKDVSVIKAVQWIRKLHFSFLWDEVESAISLVYRGGSLGSIGKEILSDCLICQTAGNSESPMINGSGRISFELIDENGDRISESANTQSSAFLLFSNDEKVRSRFVEAFSQFGVVFKPL